MEKINNYKNLLIWQRSMTLVEMVYVITKSLPKNETFNLTSQINRSCVSVPSNIAEGSSRSGEKDFIQFLKVSRGSLFELETQLILVRNLYKIKVDKELGEIEEIGKMISTLIKRLSEKTKNYKLTSSN